MTPAGTYAIYQGRRYLVSVAGRDHVWLPVSRAELHDLVGNGIVERADDGPYGPSLKVERSALDRLITRHVDARWRGVKVSVEDVRGDLADFYTLAGPDWAAENGIEGSQHDGWYGTAPLAELTEVEEEEQDLPLVRDW